MSVTLLSCPKCGASLARQPGEPSIRCRFCGTAVEVDAPRTAAPVAPPARGSTLLYVALGLPAVMLGALALVVLLRRPDAATQKPGPAPGDPLAETTARPTAEPPRAPAVPSASAVAPQGPVLADLAFTFGEKGSGPGQLDDPRAIAVDKGGDIFVADYKTARVQRFDPTGKLVSAIRVERRGDHDLVHGLAASFDGHLWVSCGGDLFKLALPDGKVVRMLKNQQPKLSYGGLAIDQTNTVFAANYGAGSFVSTNGEGPRSDDVRKLDKNGATLGVWKDINRGFSGAFLAVDGAGLLYVAEERSAYLDIVDARGKVKDRIRHKIIVEGVAIDGKGRILLATHRGVSVWDATGQELGNIGTAELSGVAVVGARVHTVSRREGRVEVWTLR